MFIHFYLFFGHMFLMFFYFYFFFILQVTLIDFLFLSKCLLSKSRRLLLDVAQTQSQQYQNNYANNYDPDNSYGLAPSSPGIQSLRHNSSLNLYNNSSFGSSSGLNTQTNSINGPVPGVNMSSVPLIVPPGQAKTILLSLNALVESNTVWQKEMEKGYDNLLDAILPLLGNMPNTSKLYR